MSGLGVFNNIPIKKIGYKKRKGWIEVKLYDGHYNLIYQKKANINRAEEIKDMMRELSMKGFTTFKESSWF